MRGSMALPNATGGLHCVVSLDARRVAGRSLPMCVASRSDPGLICAPRFLRALQNIADEYGVAVVVTNQVRAAGCGRNTPSALGTTIGRAERPFSSWHLAPNHARLPVY